MNEAIAIEHMNAVLDAMLHKLPQYVLIRPEERHLFLRLIEEAVRETTWPSIIGHWLNAISVGPKLRNSDLPEPGQVILVYRTQLRIPEVTP